MLSLRQLQVFNMFLRRQRLLLALFMVGMLLSLSARAEVERMPAQQSFLYRVVLPVPLVSPQDSQPKRAFEALVLEGMNKLLLRLTGSRQIAKRAVYRPFLQHPKKWLSAYYYRPKLEEGVVVGQELVLQFDRQRLLKAFQQAGIIIWPFNQRPAILVLGRYQVADVSVLLDVAGLSQHLNVDFRPVAQSLGLPVVPFVGEPPSIEASLVEWAQTPPAQWTLSQWANQYEVPVILLFDLLRTEAGYQIRYLTWQKKASSTVQETHELAGRVLPSLYETLFMAVAEPFSEAYRAEASVLGEVSLVIHNPPSAASVLTLEKTLQSLKPTLHEVHLQQVSRNRLVFDITYQGNFKEMVQVLQQATPLALTKVNAIMGQIQAQWQRPQTPLDKAP